MNEYTRTDLADAAVAAAYERAADYICQDYVDYVWHKPLAENIRALATSEQANALERVRRE